MDLTQKEQEKIKKDREFHQERAISEIKFFEGFLKRELTQTEKNEIMESDDPHYVKDKSFYWEYTAKFLMSSNSKPKLTFWEKLLKKKV